MSFKSTVQRLEFKGQLQKSLVVERAVRTKKNKPTNFPRIHQLTRRDSVRGSLLLVPLILFPSKNELERRKVPQGT
jgi:hypothetical protein